MTRVDTQSPPHSVYITKGSKTTQLCQFIAFLAVVLTCVAAYFGFPCKSLLSFSEDSHFKSVPDVYNSPETVDPEDRDVFAGFKTSFLPEVEVMLARRQHGPSRIKRRCRLPYLSYQYEDLVNEHSNGVDEDNDNDADDSDDYDDDDDEDDTEYIEHKRKMNEEEETNENGDEYDDTDEIKSVVPPEPHVDRGPLDDVVEQIRGQPELEEGEMGSSTHVFKPARSYTGQGDMHKIRETQAKIMKQFMDAEADPCHDFYQYACGNWAGLNPIPADKAGYDTFEMLRENLDTVLKDLLEFKANEKIPSKFPGKHLIFNEIYVSNHFVKEPDTPAVEYHKVAKGDSPQGLNRTSIQKSLIQQEKPRNFHETSDNSHEISRMRRFSRRPSNDIGHLLKYRLKKQIYLKDDSKHRELIERFRVKSAHKKALIGKKLTQQIKPIKYARKLLSHQNVGDRPKREKRFLDKFLHLKRKRENRIEDMSKGDAALKARFLFKSCMNYDILKQRGHQPLLDLLHLLGGWPILDRGWDSSSFDWLKLMAELRLYNNDILISEWVGPDIKNSNEFVIQFDQTSLGLPTRDYFLQASNKPYLDAYKRYLITIALLLGGDPDHVHKSADELIEFEIRLAKITSAPEDRRNVSELYRRMPLYKLTKLVPEVDWSRYLCIVMNRTVNADETVVLFALPYVRNLVKLINENKPHVLSNYLLWRFVRHRVNNLDDRFQVAKQQFYYILFGREQAPPRWKNCISQVNSNMGMALGSMFVRKYFDETSKNDTLTMTREIQQSFRELLHMTDWIDDETKRLAAVKVDAIMLRIGYPDFILKKEELDDRYKEVLVHPDKYFENILNILQHLTKMEQSRIGQPVNKSLWNTAPAVVNAYYSRNKNQIMFPAGILQPPFYHRHFPRSLNYGGIGVVIGHEITHGFDDKGRLFDSEGNLHRWWSDTAIEHFHQRAQGLIDQYGKYVVPEVNMKLDGVNTQGENIADNGGVKQAFRAYLRWLKKNGSENETLPGLNHTHTQLFFLNFAQVWCGAMRPEAMRNKLKTAVHSPGRFRVIGTLCNSYDFAREFNCPVGSEMNPTNKYSVW